METEKKEEIENSSETFKKTRLAQIAPSYYSRKDIQEAICEFCRQREVVPKYFEGFGKRPDTLEYPSEVYNQVKKGATSFHCSEEIWADPLKISTELGKKELDELRAGWDLIIDIDSKYLDYSKIMTKLLVKALKFHGVKNVGIKFSGSKGMHLIIPWKAFPKEVRGLETKKMFPDFPRAVCLYINDFIRKELIDALSKLTGSKSYVKDFESADKVAPDLVLVSSRHLFRTPYSLHEKTGLASIVIPMDNFDSFEVKDADPMKVKVIPYTPEVKEGEATELLLHAIDWHENKIKDEKQKKEEQIKKFSSFPDNKSDFKLYIDKNKLVHPPCITQILENTMEDGRKRSLFILLAYFRSLDFSKEETEKKILEWNIKNKKPLNDGYIKSQFDYAFKSKQVPPPNCDKSYYKDIQVCAPDNFCNLIKNPLNYARKKAFQNQPSKEVLKKTSGKGYYKSVEKIKEKEEFYKNGNNSTSKL